MEPDPQVIGSRLRGSDMQPLGLIEQILCIIDGANLTNLDTIGLL